MNEHSSDCTSSQLSHRQPLIQLGVRLSVAKRRATFSDAAPCAPTGQGSAAPARDCLRMCMDYQQRLPNPTRTEALMCAQAFHGGGRPALCEERAVPSHLERRTGVEVGSMAAGEATGRGTGRCRSSRSLTAPGQGLSVRILAALSHVVRALPKKALPPGLEDATVRQKGISPSRPDLRMSWHACHNAA